jgi:hypothetical protein
MGFGSNRMKEVATAPVANIRLVSFALLIGMAIVGLFDNPGRHLLIAVSIAIFLTVMALAFRRKRKRLPGRVARLWKPCTKDREQ